jgi:hypothetical protein
MSQRSLLVVGGVLAVAAVGAAGGLYLWASADPPEPIVVEFADLPVDAPVIRIRGTAHYMAMVRQDVPGNLIFEPKTFYVYGLFATHDTSSKAIRLLVRTEVPPEDGVGFEFLELEGWLMPPDRHTVPFHTEDLLAQQSDYFFTEDLQVLQPWHQESFDPGRELRKPASVAPPTHAAIEDDDSEPAPSPQ